MTPTEKDRRKIRAAVLPDGDTEPTAEEWAALWADVDDYRAFKQSQQKKTPK